MKERLCPEWKTCEHIKCLGYHPHVENHECGLGHGGALCRKNIACIQTPNIIQFSHKYYKFPAAYENSMVAQIIVMEEKDISQPFREYDTVFTSSISADDFYPLPKGKIILILLIANSGQGWLWTTIRRWTPEKEKYYMSTIGEIVLCEVTGK